MGLWVRQAKHDVIYEEKPFPKFENRLKTGPVYHAHQKVQADDKNICIKIDNLKRLLKGKDDAAKKDSLENTYAARLALREKAQVLTYLIKQQDPIMVPLQKAEIVRGKVAEHLLAAQQLLEEQKGHHVEVKQEVDKADVGAAEVGAAEVEQNVPDPTQGSLKQYMKPGSLAAPAEEPKVEPKVEPKDEEMEVDAEGGSWVEEDIDAVDVVDEGLPPNPQEGSPANQPREGPPANQPLPQDQLGRPHKRLMIKQGVAQHCQAPAPPVMPTRSAVAIEAMRIVVTAQGVEDLGIEGLSAILKLSSAIHPSMRGWLLWWRGFHQGIGDLLHKPQIRECMDRASRLETWASTLRVLHQFGGPAQHSGEAKYGEIWHAQPLNVLVPAVLRIGLATSPGVTPEDKMVDKALSSILHAERWRAEEDKVIQRLLCAIARAS